MVKNVTDLISTESFYVDLGKFLRWPKNKFHEIEFNFFVIY